MHTKAKKRLLSRIFGFLFLIAVLAVAVYFLLSPVFLARLPFWGFAREVPQPEQALRLQVVQTAENWMGAREKDNSHLPILDIYNSHPPLARGYAMKPHDAWCSAFVSTVAIQCQLTDIIPTEVGCEKHTLLFKELGSWMEADSYIPLPGDYIFYSWRACYEEDCTHSADHVGIVVGTWGNYMLVIEGNMDDAVGYRVIPVNYEMIRGFGIPDYAGKS